MSYYRKYHGIGGSGGAFGSGSPGPDTARAVERAAATKPSRPQRIRDLSKAEKRILERALLRSTEPGEENKS
jgi:hypothetical protein